MVRSAAFPTRWEAEYVKGLAGTTARAAEDGELDAPAMPHGAELGGMMNLEEGEDDADMQAAMLASLGGGTARAETADARRRGASSRREGGGGAARDGEVDAANASRDGGDAARDGGDAARDARDRR